MRKYVIQLSSAAAKQLRKLDPPAGKKVFKDIQNLTDDPRPHGYEQLTGKGKLYRLPIGPGKDYRIIYEVEDEKLLVSILKIGDRKEIYRDL